MSAIVTWDFDALFKQKIQLVPVCIHLVLRCEAVSYYTFLKSWHTADRVFDTITHRTRRSLTCRAPQRIAPLFLFERLTFSKYEDPCLCARVCVLHILYDCAETRHPYGSLAFGVSGRVEGGVCACVCACPVSAQGKEGEQWYKC